jgi:predicted nucleic acid-binding protein
VSSVHKQALRCLLDTNVVIGLLKGEAASVALVQSANCQLAEMAVSQITRLELLSFHGIDAEETRTIDDFLVNIQVLAFSSKVEDQIIALRQTRKIKLPDAIVAATAIANQLELLTLDQSLARSFQVMAS